MASVQRGGIFGPHAPAESRRRAYFLGAVAAVFAIELWALNWLSGEGRFDGVLPWVATIDLLLFPLLLYALFFGWRRLIRPSDWLLLAVGGVGLKLLTRFVPEPARLPEGLDTMALAGVELLVMVKVALSLRSVIAGFRRLHAAGEGLYASLREALAASLSPGLARYVALETSVLATVFAAGAIRRAEGNGELFSYSRRSGAGPLYAAVGMVALVEAVGLHYLLILWLPERWHGWVWLLTALGLYLLVWIIADYRAMKLQPHRIRAGVLELRLGFRWWARLPLDQVTLAARFGSGDRAEAVLTPRSTRANVVVETAEPFLLHSITGKEHTVRRIAIVVDEPERFVAALHK